jgi:putative ABC transport system permease protein
MIRDYFVLAFKSLKHRGIRSWLTMLGIFIGIAAVVSLISLGSGLSDAITGQFSDLAPDRLVIQNAETGFGPPGSTAVKKLNSHDLSVIESVSNIDLVVPRLVRVVNVEYNRVSVLSYAGSIPESDEGTDFIYSSFSVEAQEGRLLRPSDTGKIVLGNDFISYDQFGKRVRVGSKLSINGQDFEVIGILQKTGTFTINSVILINEEDLRDALDIGDEYDLIVVQVDSEKNTARVASSLEDRLRRDRDLDEGKEDFSVNTPQQALESINTILSIINLVVVGIAAISLFIGGIGIANTMYTSVLERRKEIGIMKAVGARNSDILGIFVFEAGLLGLAGGIIGSIIGLGLAFLVTFIVSIAAPGLNLSVSPSYPLLFGAISFSFVIGVLSGLFPALQAANLKPVEALRQ